MALMKRVCWLPLYVDHDKCPGCKACLRLGYPAITWGEENQQSNIDKIVCVGCKVCQQTCGFDAFIEYGE